MPHAVLAEKSLRPLNGDFPERKLEQVRSLPPMNVLKETVKILRWRLFVALESEQRGKLFVGHWEKFWLMKLSEEVLQLAMRVK
jgi:hypothetical protein